jgi:hypothetical protein
LLPVWLLLRIQRKYNQQLIYPLMYHWDRDAMANGPYADTDTHAAGNDHHGCCRCRCYQMKGSSWSSVAAASDNILILIRMGGEHGEWCIMSHKYETCYTMKMMVISYTRAAWQWM